MRPHFLLLLLAGCSTSAAPDPGRAPPPGPNASAAPPVQAGPLSVPADVDPYELPTRAGMTLPDAFWDELTECLPPRACAGDDGSRARDKAAVAFPCEPVAVDIARRRDAVRDDSGRGLRVSLPGRSGRFAVSTQSWVEGSPRGNASMIVKADSAVVYEVAGCGAWGVVVCAKANRSVRTATSTYENASDRVCLWGHAVAEGG